MSTLGERIRIAREENDLQQKELAELVEVKSSGVISNWERDLNKPDAEKIIKICEVLHISASYLLDYYGESSFQCTMSEQKLVTEYRSLDILDKKIINDTLSTMQQRRTKTTETEQAKEFIVLQPDIYKPRIGAYGGAGLGVYLFDSDQFPPQMIAVPDKFEDCDFVIGINGDSMETMYSDDDDVAIKKQPSINRGEIGLFILNNECLIKKFMGDRLVSLNSEYNDIVLCESDSFKCIGKVLGKI